MKVKQIIASAAAAIVLVAPALAVAYSPERTTYTCNSAGQCVGADHVQFNSFTNNPGYGDERNFLMIRDADAATTTYTDSKVLTDGKEYVLRFYVHNNAQQSLSGANNYVAKDTKVRVELPAQFSGAAKVNGFISASNANPGSIGDDVNLSVASGTMKLDYVAGSAKIRTNALTDVAVSDAIVTSAGAPVGYDALNGNWPGCFEFSGWVTLKVKASAVTTPTPEQPKPSFKCDALSVTKVNRTRFDFSTTASASNATIASYVFTTKDKDGKVVDTKTVTTSATNATYTFERDVVGTYTISVVVKTDKGDAEVGSCSKAVTVEATPTTTTPATTTPTKSIPNTGAGGVIGAFMGISLIAGVAHYVWSIRRSASF